ncbi:gliding motility lipoprotein GldD [Aegicerativicinus sediminis]
MKLVSIVIATACLLVSCGDEPLPKPKAELRLDYPKPAYHQTDIAALPFTFEKNDFAKPISKIKYDPNTGTIGVDVEYPSMKGTIYLTYKPVDGNLTNLLRDAQELTQKHVSKADEIAEQVYQSPEKKSFGMFYEVGGNAASQSQFYLTDSTNHFLNGSLYFYAKPNFDSLYPAAVYLKNDIRHIMETLEWK